MNVSLTPELETLVNEKVASGMYHSASEVIRAGLRLLKEEDVIREVRLLELKRDILLGVEQADRGELVPAEDVFNAIYERHKQETCAK